MQPIAELQNPIASDLEERTAHRPIYTIGYGSRSIDEFIETLKKYDVRFVGDVRSHPYSKYKPDFSKDNLAAQLAANGIVYVFLGDSLGGRPADRDCYDDDNSVVYDKVRTKPFYLAGIDRVDTAWRKNVGLALMCSEGKPEQCHRTKLIGISLEKRGIGTKHIDESGRLLSQEDVNLRLSSGQTTFLSQPPKADRSRKRYADPAE